MIVTTALAIYLMVAALVPPELVMVAAQAALAAVPLVVVLGLRGRVVAELGLRGAPPRFFLAAIAIGATTWYLNARLSAELPLPRGALQQLAALVDRPSLAVALATFAVLPALCEELVFRGVLARALGRRMPVVAAAAISAVVFSAYHLSVVQALPTCTLGFLLAVIAIRADSVLPTMLAHLINNALTLAISRDDLPTLADWLGRHPSAALAGGAAATAAGIALAWWGPARERGDGIV